MLRRRLLAMAAIGIPAFACVPVIPAAFAATEPSISSVNQATSDVRRMLNALATKNYEQFVQGSTGKLHSLSQSRFDAFATRAGSRLPLQKPYHLKFLATQRNGLFLSYVFEATWEKGNQTLVILSQEDGKTAFFRFA